MDWLIRHVNMPWWTGFLFGTPEDWGNDPLADNLKGCIFLPVLLHPYSRGFVYLQPHVHDRAAAHGTHKTQLSREAKISFENPSQIPGAAFINPLLDPVVDPRYLEDERDLQTLLKGEFPRGARHSWQVWAVLSDELCKCCELLQDLKWLTQ